MYITLNRKSEWERALLIGLTIDGHIIRGDRDSGAIADSALMITGVIDSFDHDHIWERVLIDADLNENTNCSLSYFAADSKTQEINGELVDLDAWLGNENINKEQRAHRSEDLFTQVELQNGDALLACRGRYLWLRLDIIAAQRSCIAIKSIKLRLPGEHITDYLPEVYTRGLTEADFFPRFMTVFDSVFFDLEEDIDRIGEKLDCRTADIGMLTYEASWLGILNPSGDVNKLRSQISAAAKEYKMAGTKEGLTIAITEQTGLTPIIIEHFQVEKMAREGAGRHTYEALFGENPYKVYILLPQQALTSREKISALTSRINSCIPAHVSFEIIPLRDSVTLDKHTYLDVNSLLSDYSSMIIEEKSTLHRDVYIGNIENNENGESES